MTPADQGRATSTSTEGVSFGAANDDHGPVAPVARELPASEAVGWDPFEVWRTRVRDPRRDWRAGSQP